jgi:hypothetical protein
MSMSKPCDPSYLGHSHTGLIHVSLPPFPAFPRSYASPDVDQELIMYYDCVLW